MKGMQKIKRGKTFNGLISYLLKPASHHKLDPSVVGGNVIESFAEALSAEFNATKLLRSDVSKPVWHNSLRLPAGESLSIQRWKMLADDYMKRMGFSETHLRAYVLHDDKDGQHIHIVASRIDATSGKLYLGKNENLISTRIIQDLEKDYQLTQTKGADALKPSSSPVKRKKSRNEAMQEKRTGKKCPKTIIQEAIDTLITSKISEDEFVQQLAAQKIKAIPNRASTGKMNGFSFEYANISFKASQLGKKYSWKNLEPFIIIAPLAVDDRKASIAFNATNPEEIIRIVKADAVSFFGGIDAENTLLPLSVLPVVDDIYQEKVKTTGKSYVDVAMRWIETIPFIDTIVITLKKLRNPLLRAFKQPPKIFSATPLYIHNTPLSAVEKTIKSNVFRSKI
ncbi:relaxase/mobilization nuclease domain-containing protein [Salmonella enterica]|uniref:relaxase/mobilization nuclease domain-containing protein n=1 Tax=Enterobacterales TaxID=91347 RepID=UPI000F95B9C4|nr:MULTISPECIES: relaxase/mobilization nuclease domain-containing protein [Enterobacterales]EIP9140071.1 relaxase/mobilization nuclease domain-containing protein [Salmonella enterica]MET61143.1 relaxase [Salmonella enterica subsp. enterica serovar Newport]HCP1491190.1 relaxase/mobilization nuclease domain-containing protein [Escherichia coli]EKB8747974.1 relaxase/mobilization nuclease domain-containing protein [Salmonella enterica]EKB8749778.1 relaxase/mobilization nuclease domain-containing p